MEEEEEEEAVFFFGGASSKFFHCLTIVAAFSLMEASGCLRSLPTVRVIGCLQRSSVGSEKQVARMVVRRSSDATASPSSTALDRAFSKRVTSSVVVLRVMVL